MARMYSHTSQNRKLEPSLVIPAVSRSTFACPSGFEVHQPHDRLSEQLNPDQLEGGSSTVEPMAGHLPASLSPPVLVSTPTVRILTSPNPLTCIRSLPHFSLFPSCLPCLPFSPTTPDLSYLPDLGHYHVAHQHHRAWLRLALSDVQGHRGGHAQRESEDVAGSHTEITAPSLSALPCHCLLTASRTLHPWQCNVCLPGAHTVLGL